MKSVPMACMMKFGRPLLSYFPKTVGVMGDARSYEYVCALRAVTSTDGMTAESYPFWFEPGGHSPGE